MYSLAAIVATQLVPLVDPVTGLTVDDAMVSTLPLNLVTVGTALLVALIVLSFAVLYSAFSGPVEEGESHT